MTMDSMRHTAKQVWPPRLYDWKQLQQAGYNPYAADVWSFGMMLFTLCSGLKPFASPCSTDPVFRAFVQHTQPNSAALDICGVHRVEPGQDTEHRQHDEDDGKILFSLWDRTPGWEWPPAVSSELRDLITSCLQLDPQLRISMEEVCRHPWFCKSQTEDCTHTERASQLKQVHHGGVGVGKSVEETSSRQVGSCPTHACRQVEAHQTPQYGSSTITTTPLPAMVSQISVSKAHSVECPRQAGSHAPPQGGHICALEPAAHSDHPSGPGGVTAALTPSRTPAMSGTAAAPTRPVRLRPLPVEAAAVQSHSLAELSSSNAGSKACTTQPALTAVHVVAGVHVSSVGRCSVQLAPLHNTSEEEATTAPCTQCHSMSAGIPAGAAGALHGSTPGLSSSGKHCRELETAPWEHAHQPNLNGHGHGHGLHQISPGVPLIQPQAAGAAVTLRHATAHRTVQGRHRGVRSPMSITSGASVLSGTSRDDASCVVFGHGHEQSPSLRVCRGAQQERSGDETPGSCGYSASTMVGLVEQTRMTHTSTVPQEHSLLHMPAHVPVQVDLILKSGARSRGPSTGSCGGSSDHDVFPCESTSTTAAGHDEEAS